MVDVGFLYAEGLACHRQGDLEGAEFRYRKVLEHDGRHGGALHFLGVIALFRQRLDEALELIGRALDISSDKAVFHNNHGVVLKELGRPEEALAAFEKATELDAGYADAWSNRGLAHFLLDDLDAAETFLDKALAIQPGHADARRHLANVLHRHAALCATKKDFAGAQSRLEKAIERDPYNEALPLALGSLLAEQERFDEADQLYADSAALLPGKSAWSWKRLGHCPAIFDDDDQIEAYWSRLDGELDRAVEAPPTYDLRAITRDGFLPSFNLPHLGRCCRSIKEKFAAIFRDAFPRVPRELKNKARKRIGFVATDGHYRGFLRMIGGIVARLDGKRFEPVLFCDAFAVEHCRRAIGRDDLKIVTLDGRFDRDLGTIRAVSCDVLYHWKAGGGPRDWFLPFARLAPVQCTSIGTHGTSGNRDIDWYLSSRELENGAVDADAHYSERLFRGEGFPCFMTRMRAEGPLNRARYGIPDTGTLYFCPHRLPKYHPMFDEYVAEILDGDPGGSLVMLSNPESTPGRKLADRMRRRLGATLFKRVVMLPYQDPAEMYRFFASADMVLDTPSYTGGISGYDAFSFSTPVVTQRGEIAVQHQMAGLYDRLGMADFPAKDRKMYVETALELARNTDFRRYVRGRIAAGARRIFNDAQAVTDFETFCETALADAANR